MQNGSQKQRGLIAFCVGGSPIDNPEIDIALKRNFSESEQKKVKTISKRSFICLSAISLLI
jgi:hypothetical protein